MQHVFQNVPDNVKSYVVVVVSVAKLYRTLATPRTVDPMLLCPWDCPGRRARVACHLLLQGILSTQVLSLHLLPWQLDSSPPSREGSPVYSYVAALSLLLCPRPVTKLCASLCDPIDCSRPGFPFLHCLPEFAQMHVH